MIHLPIYAALTAALLMFLQLTLMMLVGFARIRTTQSIGDGGDPELLMAIRRHGNLIENAPTFIAILVLLEMLAGTSTLILTLGLAFLAVRVAHAVGMSMGIEPNFSRAIGAFGTLALSLGTAGYLTWVVVSFL